MSDTVEHEAIMALARAWDRAPGCRGCGHLRRAHTAQGCLGLVRCGRGVWCCACELEPADPERPMAGEGE